MRLLAAVVVRSSMMAIITMVMLGDRGLPDVERLQGIDYIASKADPFTSAAMVAIDSAAIVHWLMPMHVVRLAIGNWICRSSWPRVTPRQRAALIVFPETARMPCSVMRISGGSA